MAVYHTCHIIVQVSKYLLFLQGGNLQLAGTSIYNITCSILLRHLVNAMSLIKVLQPVVRKFEDSPNLVGVNA